MELRVSFEPGAAQSSQAASYFNGVIASAVEPWLEHWVGRTYGMEVGEAPRLRWRIWSDEEWSPEELSTLFVWLLIIREDIDRLQRGSMEEEAIGRMVANWIAVRHDSRSFFLEETVLGPDVPVDQQEPDLVLGVLGGRTIMASTDELLFTRLGDGLHGIALAGHGSYLLEDVEGNMSARQFRKAS